MKIGSCIRRVEEGLVDELADDLIMDVHRLRKANRLPRQALDPCPEVQVLPLNRLCIAFGDQMFILREIALISLSAIGAVQDHVPRLDQG